MGVQLFILSAHVEYTAVYRMGVGGIGTREETRGEAVIHKTTQTHPLRLGAVKIPSPGSASQKFHEGSCGPRRRFVSNGCRNPPPPVVAGWLEVVVEQNKWVSHSAHARPQRRRDGTGPWRAKPNPTEAVPPLRKASCHPKMPRQGRQDLLPSAAAFKVRTSPFFCRK